MEQLTLILRILYVKKYHIVAPLPYRRANLGMSARVAGLQRRTGRVLIHQAPRAGTSVTVRRRVCGPSWPYLELETLCVC